MMNNTMTYKGYIAQIEFDSRDGIFVGRVLGIIDSITFHGQTVHELESDFRAAIDQYLTDCDATGRQPEGAPTGERA
jgi:predicted HicB family RNase H-like nuclease